MNETLPASCRYYCVYNSGLYCCDDGSLTSESYNHDRYHDQLTRKLTQPTDKSYHRRKIRFENYNEKLKGLAKYDVIPMLKRTNMVDLRIDKNNIKKNKHSLNDNIKKSILTKSRKHYRKISNSVSRAERELNFLKSINAPKKRTRRDADEPSSNRTGKSKKQKSTKSARRSSTVKFASRPGSNRKRYIAVPYPYAAMPSNFPMNNGYDNSLNNMLTHSSRPNILELKKGVNGTTLSKLLSNVGEQAPHVIKVADLGSQNYGYPYMPLSMHPLYRTIMKYRPVKIKKNKDDKNQSTKKNNGKKKIINNMIQPVNLVEQNTAVNKMDFFPIPRRPYPPVVQNFPTFPLNGNSFFLPNSFQNQIPDYSLIKPSLQTPQPLITYQPVKTIIIRDSNGRESSIRHGSSLGNALIAQAIGSASPISFSGETGESNGDEFNPASFLQNALYSSGFSNISFSNMFDNFGYDRANEFIRSWFAYLNDRVEDVQKDGDTENTKLRYVNIINYQKPNNQNDISKHVLQNQENPISNPVSSNSNSQYDSDIDFVSDILAQVSSVQVKPQLPSSSPSKPQNVQGQADSSHSPFNELPSKVNNINGGSDESRTKDVIIPGPHYGHFLFRNPLKPDSAALYPVSLPMPISIPLNVPSAPSSVKNDYSTVLKPSSIIPLSDFSERPNIDAAFLKIENLNEFDFEKSNKKREIKKNSSPENEHISFAVMDESGNKHHLQDENNNPRTDFNTTSNEVTSHTRLENPGLGPQAASKSHYVPHIPNGYAEIPYVQNGYTEIPREVYRHDVQQNKDSESYKPHRYFPKNYPEHFSPHNYNEAELPQYPYGSPQEFRYLQGPDTVVSYPNAQFDTLSNQNVNHGLSQNSPKTIRQRDVSASITSSAGFYSNNIVPTGYDNKIEPTKYDDNGQYNNIVPNGFIENVATTEFNQNLASNVHNPYNIDSSGNNRNVFPIGYNQNIYPPVHNQKHIVSTRHNENDIVAPGYNHNTAPTGHRQNIASAGFHQNTAPTDYNNSIAPPGYNHNTAPTGNSQNIASAGYSQNSAPIGYNNNISPTGYNQNNSPTGYKDNIASAGNNQNAATTGFNQNIASAGFNQNIASAGFNQNRASAGYNQNIDSAGNNQNAATNGYNQNIASAGFNQNIASAGFNQNIASAGFNQNIASAGYNQNIASAGYNQNTASAGYNQNTASAGYNQNIASAGYNQNAAPTEYNYNEYTAPIEYYNNISSAGYNRNTAAIEYAQNIADSGYNNNIAGYDQNIADSGYNNDIAGYDQNIAPTAYNQDAAATAHNQATIGHNNNDITLTRYNPNAAATVNNQNTIAFDSYSNNIRPTRNSLNYIPNYTLLTTEPTDIIDETAAPIKLQPIFDADERQLIREHISAMAELCPCLQEPVIITVHGNDCECPPLEQLTELYKKYRKEFGDGLSYVNFLKVHNNNVNPETIQLSTKLFNDITIVPAIQKNYFDVDKIKNKNGANSDLNLYFSSESSLDWSPLSTATANEQSLPKTATRLIASSQPSPSNRKRNTLTSAVPILRATTVKSPLSPTTVNPKPTSKVSAFTPKPSSILRAPSSKPSNVLRTSSPKPSSILRTSSPKPSSILRTSSPKPTNKKRHVQPTREVPKTNVKSHFSQQTANVNSHFSHQSSIVNSHFMQQTT